MPKRVTVRKRSQVAVRELKDIEVIRVASLDLGSCMLFIIVMSMLVKLKTIIYK